VKTLLAILSIPLLLVLSGCGGSDDPARGISNGTQVVYRDPDIIGHDVVYGKSDPQSKFDKSIWLVGQSENTITVRFANGFESVIPKSNIVWMKEAKDPKPMPPKKIFEQEEWHLAVTFLKFILQRDILYIADREKNTQ